MEPEKLLTTEDVMELLQVSQSTVRNLTKSGELPRIKFPGEKGAVRYRLSDVQAFIQRKAQ